ncbi:hypothetical protein GEMRC1_004548 [Eukaryota sp. GEM-RC1]
MTNFQFQNVFGELLKDSVWTDIDIKASSTAWDGRLSCINSKWLAFVMASTGPGSVCVLPVEGTNNVGPNSPTILNHTNEILALAFAPFNEDVIATAGNDGTIKVWRITKMILLTVFSLIMFLLFSITTTMLVALLGIQSLTTFLHLLVRTVSECGILMVVPYFVIMLLPNK